MKNNNTKTNNDKKHTKTNKKALVDLSFKQEKLNKTKQKQFNLMERGEEKQKRYQSTSTDFSSSCTLASSPLSPMATPKEKVQDTDPASDSADTQ